MPSELRDWRAGATVPLSLNFLERFAENVQRRERRRIAEKLNECIGDFVHDERLTHDPNAPIKSSIRFCIAIVEQMNDG